MNNPSRYIITKNDKSKREKTIFASDIGIKYEKLDNCEIPIYAQVRKPIKYSMGRAPSSPIYSKAAARKSSRIYKVPVHEYEVPVRVNSSPIYATIGSSSRGGRKSHRKSKKKKNNKKLKTVAKRKTYKRSNS